MKWLILVFLIFLLLISIGLIKIKLKFILENNSVSKIVLRILFFDFTVFSDSGSLKKEKKVKNKKQIKPQKVKKKKIKPKNKQPVSEKINLLFLILEPAFNFLKFLNKGFKIKDVNLNVQVATGDAFKTAIFYGKFCCWFYSLLKLFRSIFNVEIRKLCVAPNFVSESFLCNLSFCLQIGIGRVVVGVLRLLFVVIFKIFLNKIKYKKERLN